MVEEADPDRNAARSAATVLFLEVGGHNPQADELHSTIPDGVRALGNSTGAEDRSRIMPGAVFLPRQNARVVVEGEFFVLWTHRPSVFGRDAGVQS